MSQFMTDLFRSILTPGPTPTLIVATNATFAALQLLFFVLLVATYSIHFLVLSCLSGGLWWAIDWFVAELRTQQALAIEREPKTRSATESEASDTEAETVVEAGGPGPRSSEVEIVPTPAELTSRTTGVAKATRSEASTEDEWEKVSESEKDK